MDNTIYITLSKELGMFRQMDVHANNLANVDTTGFNREAMIFNSYLFDDGNRNKMAFAHDVATVRDTSPGSIKQTGNPLDVAIQGKGYFQIETPLGTRYTRAGNFQIDGEGTLVTADGSPVLDGTGQRIVFEPNDRDVEINSTGAITVKGDERGQIGIVQFDNEQLLDRVTDTYYKSDADPLPAENAQVLQGVLEGSNVQAVTELTSMLKLARSVSSTAKFIETAYDLQRRASTTLTKQS